MRAERAAPKPVRAKSPVVRELFNIASQRRHSLEALAVEINAYQENLSTYRTGKVTPKIDRVEQIAKALGYRLVLEPADAAPLIRSTEGMRR